MENQLTKSFTLREFACHDGTPVPDKLVSNAAILAKNLQAIEDAIGVPLLLSSVYRTPTYNKRIGGKIRSKHLECLAADIHTRHHTPRQLHALIEKLIKAGTITQGGLGLYPSFVHYDARGTRSRWYEI